MAGTMIGAQLYTVRDFQKTESDFGRTMEKIREIGYEAVQLSGHGPIKPKTLRKILDDNGVVCAATHRSYEQMRDDTDASIEEHQILNCEYPAIGGMPEDYRSPEGYVKFAQEASEIGRKFESAGMRFSYHNHSWELAKVGDRLILEMLRDESDPETFNLEIDTYWIQHGGGDPAEWIRGVKGRIPLVHFKDMAIRGDDQIMAEIGEGNLNWPAIIEACKGSGARWYLVEQDICERDPFESLKISLDNMKAMGLE